MTTIGCSFLIGSSSDKKDNYKSSDEFEFPQDPITIKELAALEHYKN